MSSVPVSFQELELIVEKCSRDLLEKLATDSEISEDSLQDWTQLSVNLTTFIIDRYMNYVNEIIESKGRELSI